MKVSPSLFALPRLMVTIVAAGVLAFVSPIPAVEWFDDFSDGNADAPPVQWTPSPVFAGSYDASSGSYVLTPTDDGSQPAGTGDENLLSTVNSVSFADTSVRTQAVVGFSTEPDPNRDADFNNSGTVGGDDFLIWQRRAGATGNEDEGDANFDGFVDDLDLDIWQLQFGGPPNLRGGNVGVLARFNPANGNGYLVVMDDGNQWNLLAVEGFGTLQTQINDLAGENVPPTDPVTGARINAAQDIMIQLDVTGQGSSTLLEVWFWKPGEPMPSEPFFSRVDDFSGLNAAEGVAGVIYNEDNANTPGIFRYVQASDTHLGDAPAIAGVPEPTSGVLALLSLISTLAISRRMR